MKLLNELARDSPHSGTIQSDNQRMELVRDFSRITSIVGRPVGRLAEKQLTRIGRVRSIMLDAVASEARVGEESLKGRHE